MQVMHNPKCCVDRLIKHWVFVCFFLLLMLFSGSIAEITQICAISWDGKVTFDRYVLPASGYISDQASHVSGLEIKTDGDQQSLLYKGDEVDAIPVKDALFEFMDWIRQQTGKLVLYKLDV